MTEFTPFIPARQPLLAIAGDTFVLPIRVWLNKEKNERYDLTGYTVTLEIEGVNTLTESDGLTVTHLEGEIVVELSDLETAAIANNETIAPGYRLRLEKEEKRTTIMRGNWTFESDQNG